MKFFTFSALAAAAGLSAVVVLPFRPARIDPFIHVFALEVRMTSSVAGNVQLYYPDAHGGLRETASSREAVVAGGPPKAYRLPLPGGNYTALRLDPIDGPGSVVIESLRFVSHTGRHVRTVAFSEVKAGNQIAALQERGGQLELTTTPGGNDPQLALTLNPPAVLQPNFLERRKGIALRALGVFAMLAGFLIILDRVPRTSMTAATMARALAPRPNLAIATVAAVAVVASAYPVVFLGKSHVSPNFGTPLLYHGFPTLPGSSDNTVVDVKGADVGAMMWAHLPYSVVQQHAFAGGELPLWNRYNSLGSPLLGQGQSMLGDPLHLWVVLWKGAAWAWDFKFLVAKWLFAMGLGLTVLSITRQEQPGTLQPATIRPEGAATVSLLSALLVSFAAPFIGFFIFRINHAAYFSLCYAPWPLYCWLRVARAEDRRAVAVWAAALLPANLALMNSGTVKEAYVLLLAINFSGLCVLLASAQSWRRRLARLAAVAWAGVLFALLTAPAWGTFLDTLVGAKTGYDVPVAYQIQPSLLLGAFDEAFYRLIPLAECVFNPSVNFLVLLGLLYFLATVRFPSGNRAALAVAGSTLVPFALAFGFVPPAWIVSVPLLANVHHIDNTFSCVLIVLWSVLAGVGFARAIVRLGTREGRDDLALAAAMLFTLVFLWVAFRQAAHRGYIGPGGTLSVVPPGEVRAVSEFVWGYLVTLLAATIVLAIVLRRTLVRQVITPANGVLMVLCVVLMLWRHGLHASTVEFENHVIRPPLRTDLHVRSPAMEFVRSSQNREPSRGYGLHDNFFMGWTGVYGLEAINSPDALMNPRVQELIAVSGRTKGMTWDFSVPPENIPELKPFFDALNVRYYFDRGHDHPGLRNYLELVQTLDLDIWESRTVWPRAFYTDRVDLYEEAADLMEKIKRGDGRPFAAVQRSDEPTRAALPGLARALESRVISPATDYELTENTTTFSVRASAPGVIVLTETHWPGDFRAALNGHEVPVLRINHAFKGVAVATPGQHRVVFRYVPRNFERNVTLCVIGAILLVVSLYIALHSTRSR